MTMSSIPESKHTPGPWHVWQSTAVKGDNRLIREENGSNIAEVYQDSEDRHIADAYLIAAAPDLLDVAKALDKYQHYFSENAHEGERMPGNDFYSELAMEIVKLARAAIAKAVQS